MKINERLVFPRTLLLVEIHRYCSFPDCRSRTSLGLTKEEARIYRGFECENCKRWNDDALCETDVPEWWSEII
jgi:hypothetical protein